MSEPTLVGVWQRLRASLSEGGYPRAVMSEDEDSIAIYFGKENHFEIEFNDDGSYSAFAMKKDDDGSEVLFPPPDLFTILPTAEVERLRRELEEAREAIRMMSPLDADGNLIELDSSVVSAEDWERWSKLEAVRRAIGGAG